MKNQQTPGIDDVFDRALAVIRERVVFSAPAAGDALAIAYSGGLDSSALLYLAHRHAQKNGIRLFAFHVHHGLSADADDWLQHCAGECARLGVTFAAQRVQLADTGVSGIEAAARSSRYAALGAMCRAHGVPLLLTAHHQDDQAETVLLQLLRGSGVAGLSGMDTANCAPDLLGDAVLVMARPLLSFSRMQLATLVAKEGITHVDDASNLDTRYARNALRHEVMPALAKFFPGFQHRLARTASHAQSAQRLLIELATQDLALCAAGDALDISRLRLLSPDRADNLLRYWFGSRGVRMPSTSWLHEMRTQLFEAKPDAQLCVTHADCHIRRHRDHVFITPHRIEFDPEELPVIGFRWSGEAQLDFPDLNGSLMFEAAEQGVAADWLTGQALAISLRSGGERLKPAPNRSTRALKYHYQAGNVPAWERERLPVVRVGKKLLFAAGVGMDCHHFSSADEPRIALRWVFAAD
ncbi:tRNA(Ile)-lysidine synthetase [Oxalobacteraceae bacterium IMCC9480]|nr:tRNA(Ile)-lysidine synthetase [Oxalobacteraceae bacterium IMCC9480]NDP57770.1 tRNA lysidine(34) synthetase TilS [Oxalobacteraceae bacterium]